MIASIVTVTHRSDRHLARYVASFLEHHGRAFADTIEFVFVENSGDAAIEDRLAPLRDAGYRVTFLTMPNRGFGAACNLGAASARGRVLAFINPDVTFLVPLAGLDGFVGGWGTGRQIDERGVAYSFDILAEHKSLFGELTRSHRRMTPPLGKWRTRVYPVGAFFCVDRAQFHILGGFDERFFLYHEEAELARRLQQALGPPRYAERIALRHHQFGSETNRMKTFDHELEGLFTYAKVTGLNSVLRKRLYLLLVLCPVRANARQRLVSFLRRLVSI